MGFRINPRGVDKNKRNTEAKQSQNKNNTGSVDDKIKQYFNSQDDIVSSDDFNDIQKSSKSFNSVFGQYQGQKWSDEIESQFKLSFQKDMGDIINNKQTQQNDATYVAQKPVAQPIKLVNVNVKTNLTQPSKVSEEELNLLLDNTPLKGTGKDFLDAEKKYGVNAMFMVSLAGVESSYGDAPARGTKYNFSGRKKLKGGFMEFKNFPDSIDSFGAYIQRRYTRSGKTTVQKVQQGGYNPNAAWGTRIVNEWNKNISKIKKYRQFQN